MPHVLSKTFKEVSVYLKDIGATATAGPYAAYSDYDEKDMDVEIGWPVGEGLPEKGPVKSGLTHSGRAVVAIHKGQYGTLKKTYDGIFKWIENEGLVSKDIVYEYYLNSPDDVPAAELLTKVVVYVE